MSTDFGKEKYGWSKYGRGFMGLVKEEDDWYCQTCGDKQPKEFPQYMIPLSKLGREYIRICSVCKHIQIKNKIGKYNIIRINQLVRKYSIYGETY